MPWWKRLTGFRKTPLSAKPVEAVRLTMQGWREKDPADGMRIWHGPQGSVLSLSIVDGIPRMPEISDEPSLRRWCRELAEGRQAGLIEVRVAAVGGAAAASLIYKRLQMPAYTFTGMLLVPDQKDFHVWTVVSGERGTTGVREAIITAELMSAGRLTIEDYERGWARDPYDPAYHGADRRVLRFLSDDECYDKRFPDHPLSIVRQVLAALPHSVQITTQEQKV